MFLERVTFTRGDIPLHVARNYIPGCRCRFRINLWAERPEAELKEVSRWPRQSRSRTVGWRTIRSRKEAYEMKFKARIGVMLVPFSP